MSNTIAQAFPEAQIVPFNWSGKNSYEARSLAGRQLAKLIGLMALRPHSRIAIIAHSHGGNAVLYALRSKEVTVAVSDVVFLGTPFFDFVRLNALSAVRVLIRILGYAIFFPLAYVMLRAFFDGLPFVTRVGSYLPATAGFEVFAGVGFLCLLFGTVLGFPALVTVVIQTLFGKALLRFLLRRRGALFRQLAVPALTVRGLVCRSPRDEAFLYLRALALVTSSPFFIWSVMVTIMRVLPLIVGVLVLAFCTGNNFVPERDAYVSDYSFKVAAIGLFSIYPAAILAMLTVAIVPALLRGNPFAFGWTGFLGAALVDVKPVPVPATRDGIPVAQISKVNRRSGFSWVHSSYYADPRILEGVVRFLRGSNIGEPVRPQKSVADIIPLLRNAIVTVAIGASAVTMLRYDYAQSKQPTVEAAIEVPPGVVPHEILAVELRDLRLAPRRLSPYSLTGFDFGNAHTVRFDLGKMLPGERCRLRGRYKSNGATIRVIVQTVGLSRHDDKVMENNLMDKWRSAGGDGLIPSMYIPERLNKVATQNVYGTQRRGNVMRAMQINWFLAGFPRGEVDLSWNNLQRKEVQFDRLMPDAEPSDLGGILLYNVGKTDPITVDLSAIITCWPRA